MEKIMNAYPVANPFTLSHCCPTGDGAAELGIACGDVASQPENRECVAVENFENVVNPLNVDGQVIGGIGNTFSERVFYDESG